MRIPPKGWEILDSTNGGEQGAADARHADQTIL
jgi:hypothetical protein